MMLRSAVCVYLLHRRMLLNPEVSNGSILRAITLEIVFV